MENGVTGRNNLKKHKSQAKLRAERFKAVQQMPEHARSVKAGELVLISVDVESAEGEVAVGLARALQNCDEGECRFLWFVRKEWCRRPRRHEWSKSPTFRVAADPTNAKKRYVTKEPLAKVLPVEVVTTEQSQRDHPRLDANCVRMIKEYCTQRGLVCAPKLATPSVDPTTTDDDAMSVHSENVADHVPPPMESVPVSSEGTRIADRLLARKQKRS